VLFSDWLEHLAGQNRMSPVVDVFFGVRGTSVSADHGYALYGAVARVLETRDDAWLHQADQVGLHLLRGAYDPRGLLLLGPRACFGLRLPAALIPKVLALAGKRLVIAGDALRVGVPHVQALRPASVLAARLVTTRNGQDEPRFDCEISRQLSGLGITALAVRGRRRVVRIKDKTVVGYGVRVAGLNVEESLRLQEHGLGGRRKLGCGVFVPVRGTAKQ
jgi:CRISPR-associated protein Cas6